MRLFLAVVLSGGLSLFASSSAVAQYPLVTAENIKTWQSGARKAVIIDTRLPEEYRQAHIPGAINIPGERMHLEKAKLPKDKATPLIFYCRGAG